MAPHVRVAKDLDGALAQTPHTARHDSAFYGSPPSSSDSLSPAPTPTPSTATTGDASLDSRTLLHVVALSNRKLNSDIFSTHSLSIHRRILVKNLLTLLYQIHPTLDWLENGSGLPVPAPESSATATAELLPTDEEHTLNAAAAPDADDHHRDEAPRNSSKQRRDNAAANQRAGDASVASFSTFSSCLPPRPALPSSPSQLSLGRPLPLPRPTSVELPQSLHSYLSAVFDVDWSVALSSSEDSLFTLAPTPSAAPPHASSLTTGARHTPSLNRTPRSPPPLSSPSLAASGSSMLSSSSLNTSRGPDRDSSTRIDVKGDASISAGPRTSLPAAVNSNKSVEHSGGGGVNLSSANKPVHTNTSSTSNSPAKSTSSALTRKSTLVPGRRSSLLHSGHVTLAIPQSSSPIIPSSYSNTGESDHATNSNGSKDHDNDSSGPSNHTGHIVASAPTPASSADIPPVISSAVSAGPGVPSQEGSRSGSPSFSRRTSSLLHVDKSIAGKHSPGSERSTVAAVGPSGDSTDGAGSFSVSIAQGMSSAKTTTTPLPNSLTHSPAYGASASRNERPSSHSLQAVALANSLGPKAMTSIKSRRQVSSELDVQTKQSSQPSHHHLQQSQQPQQPHQSSMYILPPSPPPKVPYSGAGLLLADLHSLDPAPRQPTIIPSDVASLPRASPSFPPKSPTRSLSPRISSPTSPSSGAPSLPPVFPIHSKDFLPPSTVDQHHQQQRGLQPPKSPFAYARSNSDDQIQSRVYGADHTSSTLPPPSAQSHSPPLASIYKRPSTSYGIKASKSSPDLSSRAKDPFYNIDAFYRPLPAVPVQYRPQQQQQQQRPGRSDAGFKIVARTSSRNDAFLSMPLPSIPKSSSDDEGYRYGSGGSSDGKISRSQTTNRWSSVKSILGNKMGLKVGQSGK